MSAKCRLNHKIKNRNTFIVKALRFFVVLGAGVNAQKRAVAVHHLDTPWRPSDLQQRDGRAIRKGNEIAKYFA
ncbi:hypothetical protein, partial [Capnocytophaga canis]|uniref:hypothetical protein n=1 Tax=Capnocytophaga canis TaxID=1848903 RepID=UPI0037DD7A61